MEPLGMDSGVIPDSQITASSVNNNNNSPAQARLNNFGWTAALNDLKSWLQIDLGTYKIVTRVATRGSSQSVRGSWVTSYRLQYSDDGFIFHFYQERRDTSAKVQPNIIVLCLRIFFFPTVFQSLNFLPFFFFLLLCSCLSEIKTLSPLYTINSVSQSQHTSSEYCLYSGTFTYQ